jgi:hypothetical protein
MTMVEICSGTAPGSRACSILGISSIAIDFRLDQNTNAASYLTTLLSLYTEKPVCNINLSNKLIILNNFFRQSNQLLQIQFQGFLIIKELKNETSGVCSRNVPKD